MVDATQSLANGLMPGMEAINSFIKTNESALKELEGNDEFERGWKKLQQGAATQELIVNDLFNTMYPTSDVFDINNRDDDAYIDWTLKRPSYDHLRIMGKSEPARMIKNHRRMQLIDYCKVAEQNGRGFKLKYTDRTPTKMEQKELEMLERKIVKEFFYASNYTKPSMIKHVGQSYEDWFDVDDITTEAVRAMDGFPLGLHIRDPKMFRPIVPRFRQPRWDLAQEREYNEISKATGNKIFYLKEKDFDDEGEQYKYFVFNDRNQCIGKMSDFKINKIHFYEQSDIRAARRGCSVVEQAHNVLKSIMAALTYNSSQISNNHAPQGVMAIMGGQANLVQIEKFKKLVYAHLSGAANRFKIPIIGIPEGGDMKWLPFHGSSKDLEYHLWVVLLYTILCRLSGTNPEELSMSSHEAAMTGKQIFKQDIQGIRQMSADLGLKTFLTWLSDEWNRMNLWNHIIRKSNIECEFWGLEAEVKQERLQVNEQRLQQTASVNDIKRENGEEPAVLNIDGINVFDTPGLHSNPVYQLLIKKIDLEIAKQQQNQQMQGQQQQAQTSGAGTGQNQYSETDQNLMNQYPAVEQGQQGQQK